MSWMLSIANLVKAFKTYLDTFLLNNFIMVWPLSPARWQSSMSWCPFQTLQHHPSQNIQRTFLRSLSLTDNDMPEFFRHSFLKYWTFSWICFSIVYSLFDECSRPEPLASKGIGGFKKSSPGTLRSSINDTF